MENYSQKSTVQLLLPLAYHFHIIFYIAVRLFDFHQKNSQVYTLHFQSIAAAAALTTWYVRLLDVQWNFHSWSLCSFWSGEYMAPLERRKYCFFFIRLFSSYATSFFLLLLLFIHIISEASASSHPSHQSSHCVFDISTQNLFLFLKGIILVMQQTLSSDWWLHNESHDADGNFVWSFQRIEWEDGEKRGKFKHENLKLDSGLVHAIEVVHVLEVFFLD